MHALPFQGKLRLCPDVRSFSSLALGYVLNKRDVNVVWFTVRLRYAGGKAEAWAPRHLSVAPLFDRWQILPEEHCFEAVQLGAVLCPVIIKRSMSVRRIEVDLDAPQGND